MAPSEFESRSELLNKLTGSELSLLERHGYKHLSGHEGYILEHYYIGTYSCIEICNDFREKLAYIYICKLDGGNPPEALQRDKEGRRVRELYHSLLMRHGVPLSEISAAFKRVTRNASAESIIKNLLVQFRELYLSHQDIFRDRPDILD